MTWEKLQKIAFTAIADIVSALALLYCVLAFPFGPLIAIYAEF